MESQSSACESRLTWARNRNFIYRQIKTHVEYKIT